jgi:glycerol-3-phosphate acyltransferase PlsY
MIGVILAMVASYLVGGIPFALLAGKLKGVDLRTQGSGNLGATNAIRVLGLAVGVPVLALDVLKGYVAVAAIAPLAGAGGETARVACGAAAVVGHVWPAVLRFRGGKGVATAGGVFLGLAPAATGVAIAVFVVALVLGRWVSVASMAAVIALPLALLWRGTAAPVLVAGLATTVLVLLRHRANLARLAAGTEGRVRLGTRRSAS